MAKKKQDGFGEFFYADKLSKGLLEKISPRFDKAGFAPLAHSNGCPVCNHVLRPQLEELIYHKVPFATVNQYLGEMGFERMTQAVMGKHVEKHCAVAKAAGEVSMANYLKRVTQDVTERLSGEGVLDAMLVSYVENGNPEPITNREAIAAVKTKHSMTSGKDDRRMFIEFFERVQAARDEAAAPPLDCIEGEAVPDEEPVEEEAGVAEGFEDFL